VIRTLGAVYRINWLIAGAGLLWVAVCILRGVPPHPLAAALVLIAVVALLHGSGLMLAVRFRLAPETRRKFLHVSVGLALTAGAIVSPSAVPLVAAVAFMESWFWLMRRSAGLRRKLGVVLYGVRRQDSLGDVLFPLAFLGLYWLSRGRPALFLAPALALTLADAAAAVVGTRWGRHPFVLLRARKSLEGTAAFFAVSFLAGVTVLMGSTHLGGAEAVRVALTFAAALSAVEALCSGGWDNLFVPLAGLAVLRV
jgi:phytol kinase